jgi:thiamine biosynthesis lipoprotein ApbE
VADALSTAFMLLSEEEIADLCRDGAGLEAWLLLEPGEEAAGRRFVRLAGPPRDGD